MLFTKSLVVFILLLSLSFTAFSQKYPEMVKVEGGTFIMGDISKDLPILTPKWKKFKNGKTKMFDVEGDLSKLSGTLRKVTVIEFNISRMPVSVEQYRAYCFSMGFDMPKLPNEIKETDPIVNISFEDIESYCRWLKRKTGKFYRLPTEVEWEYASKGAYLHLKTFKNNPYEINKMLYSEIPIDNDAILKQNGLIWEWVFDNINKRNKNIVDTTGRYERIVRKGTIGIKLPKDQPYNKNKIFQDSTRVDLGFRVVEPGAFKTDLYLIADKHTIGTRRY